ncbi:efflux RND transporter periplasmic adaptor subunit [Candidatus Margulisiibacteriota bacterium]
MLNKSVLALLILFVFTTNVMAKENYQLEPVFLSLPVHTVGRINHKKIMPLCFKVPGVVEAIYVKEGQKVKEGDMLAQLSKTEILAQHKKAKHAYKKAKRDLKRAQNLFKEKIITLEQLENAKTMLEIRKSDLKIAYAQIKNSKIFAPANGIILKKLVCDFQGVTAGMPALLLGSLDGGWIVQSQFTDKDILHLKKGDPALVEIESYQKHKFQAQISEISLASDPRNGTYCVTFSLKPSDKRLVPGLIAKITCFPSEKEKVYLLPSEIVSGTKNGEGIINVIKNPDNVPEKVSFEMVGILDDKIAAKLNMPEPFEILAVEGEI